MLAGKVLDCYSINNPELTIYTYYVGYGAYNIRKGESYTFPLHVVHVCQQKQKNKKYINCIMQGNNKCIPYSRLCMMVPRMVFLWTTYFSILFYRVQGM
jgi:hypothetical protein